MATAELLPVNPVRPIAPYIGGKRNLARRICALIDATPHQVYAEAFVGMGGVFFRRTRRAPVEVINDWSAEVTNLFRCMRAHPGALCELISLQLHARDDFDRAMRQDPETLTDLQRAARFVFLQKAAFGGKVTGRNFGMAKSRAPRFRPSLVGEELIAAARRLEAVSIERLPWAEFIARYDQPGALFYLDPPYYGCEDDYGPGMFGREEFAAMAEQLARLKGRFILSLNDRPQVREIFSRFRIESVRTHYGLAGRGMQAAGEVIITGGGDVPPPATQVNLGRW